jgi:hypothetical protein
MLLVFALVTFALFNSVCTSSSRMSGEPHRRAVVLGRHQS